MNTEDQFPPQAGAPAMQPQPQGMPPQGMPPQGMPQQAGSQNPLIAELDNRLRGLSPEELQNADLLLSQADPALLMLIGKIFPELQQALMLLQQMGGDQDGQGDGQEEYVAEGGDNPFADDNLSRGLMGLE